MKSNRLSSSIIGFVGWGRWTLCCFRERRTAWDRWHWFGCARTRFAASQRDFHRSLRRCGLFLTFLWL